MTRVLLSTAVSQRESGLSHPSLLLLRIGKSKILLFLHGCSSSPLPITAPPLTECPVPAWSWLTMPTSKWKLPCAEHDTGPLHISDSSYTATLACHIHSFQNRIVNTSHLMLRKERCDVTAAVIDGEPLIIWPMDEQRNNLKLNNCTSSSCSQQKCIAN